MVKYICIYSHILYLSISSYQHLDTDNQMDLVQQQKIHFKFKSFFLPLCPTFYNFSKLAQEVQNSCRNL